MSENEKPAGVSGSMGAGLDSTQLGPGQRPQAQPGQAQFGMTFGVMNGKIAIKFDGLLDPRQKIENPIMTFTSAQIDLMMKSLLEAKVKASPEGLDPTDTAIRAMLTAKIEANPLTPEQIATNQSGPAK